MTAEVAEDESVTEIQKSNPSGIIGAIAWAIESVADEIIHIGVVTGGIIMVVQQIPVPEWYTLLVGAIVTDYVKKKFKSEQ